MEAQYSYYSQSEHVGNFVKNVGYQEAHAVHAVRKAIMAKREKVHFFDRAHNVPLHGTLTVFFNSSYRGTNGGERLRTNNCNGASGL